ncbi:tectonic-1-like [Physella acuta]|uniref:tectonic-1-like n=1 Tax=Physella acuta TaxID=109671 RepID=UPI0027DD3F5B|nr:tectonic-1-like [Physella acuta]
MAASGVNMFKLGILLYVVSYLIAISVSQTTTQNTTDAENTTTAQTTVRTSTITTTRATTTTTTVAPTLPGTTIPANTDISKCPCDMTGNACDVNCCCDPECSAADKLVFSECLPNSYVLDDKLCFNKNVFLFENGPAASGDSGGLFCIYFDNDAERNYYSNPSLVKTEAEFQKYAAQYGKFSFQTPAVPTLTSQIKTQYKSGDPIYVVFENAFSYLGLPTGLSASTLCTDSNPAAYLIDQSNQCSRLLTQCSNNSVFQAATFYTGLKILKDPTVLISQNSTTGPSISNVTSLYNSTYTASIELDVIDPILCIQNGILGKCAFSVPPSAPTASSSNSCLNTVVQVKYRFVTNAKFDLDKIYVSFVFADVPISSYVQQTFSTTFTKVSANGTTPIARSGNPGYKVGLPITAGILNRTVEGTLIDDRILVNSENQHLALVRPSVSGDCLTDSANQREPILFGQDMRTGCFIQVNVSSDLAKCQSLQEAIIQAIEGSTAPKLDDTTKEYPKTNLHVAMFGNSEISMTGDWVEVLYNNRPVPTTQASTSCSLSLGANLQILYAKIGSLPNPQPKIIGVTLVYDTKQVVAYKCSGPYCQQGSSSLSQKVEISSSVTFIDVSLQPTAVEGKYPTFAVRLPYDFFYPFLNSATNVVPSALFKWMLCLLSVIILVL